MVAVLAIALAAVAEAQFERREVEASMAATFKGTAGAIRKGKLELEVDNENTMVFQLSRKTKYFDGDKAAKAADVLPGVRLTVDGRRAADGVLEAVTVRIEREKPRSRTVQ